MQPARLLRFRPKLLEAFIAPLAALVDMVRGRRVATADLPTASIAARVADYVNQVASVDIVEVAEFAAVTSSLALLKSRELTPWLLHDAGPELDLTASLKSNNTLASIDPITADLASRLTGHVESFPRVEYVEPHPREVVLAPLEPVMLRRALEGQLTAMASRLLRPVTAPIFLRIEVASRALQRSLRLLTEVSLWNVLRDDVIDRRAAVVYFLAVLDLARTRAIEVRQDGPFGDIVLTPGPGIRRAAREERVAS